MTHAKIEGFSAVWKSQEFKKQSEKAKRWLQVNALGIFVYLLAASQIWGGQNHLGLGAGDPFVWMSTAFPILVVFAIIDTVWLILALRNTLIDHRDWPQIAFWFLGVAVWMAACIFDWAME